MLRRIWVGLLLLLILAGCGGGASSPSTSGGNSGGGAPAPISSQYSSVLLRFVLSPRAIPSYVTELRFVGLSSMGDVLYGPVTFPKSSEVRLPQVATSVTQLRIEYLSGGAVRGLATVPVRLIQGETLAIVDPEFEDVDAQLLSLQIESPTSTVAAGYPVSLRARGSYNDGTQQDLTSTVSWQSSSESVATIDAGGLVATHSAGVVDMTARLGHVSSQYRLTVTAAELTGLQLNQTSLQMPRGTSATLKVTGIFSDGSQLAIAAPGWTSSNPTVASVSSAGVVEASQLGGAQIEASYHNLSAQAQVEVTPAQLTSVQIRPDQPVLAEGAEAALQLWGIFSDQTSQVLAQTTWTSSTEFVATILNNGQVTAKNPGSTIVTATDLPSGLQATTRLTVSGSPLQSLSITPGNPWMLKGKNLNLQVVGLYQDGSTRDLTEAVNYQSNNAHVSVSNSAGTRGQLLGESGGLSQLTATYPGSPISSHISVRVVDWKRSGILSLSAPVSQMLTSPDGARLYVLTGADVLVVNVETRQISSTVSGGGNWMDLSPDGNTLLITNQTNSIRALDTRTWLSTPIHTGAYATRAVGFDGPNTAYALSLGALHTLNVSALQMVGTLPDTRLGYGGFDYSRFLRVDAVTHKIFVAQTGISPATIFGYAAQGSAVSFESSVASGSNGQSLKINPGKGLVFACGGGNSLPTGGSPYRLTYYALTSFTQYLSVFHIGTYPRDAAFSPDGEVLFGINGSGYDHNVYVNRVDDGSNFTQLNLNLGTLYNVEEVEAGADGRHFFVYAYDDYHNSDPHIQFFEQP